MKYERMTSGIKIEDDTCYSCLMFEVQRVIDLINRLVELEDAIVCGELVPVGEIKAFAEAIWDNATNEDEVGARWVILQEASKRGVKLDRKLKKYGTTNKPL